MEEMNYDKWYELGLKNKYFEHIDCNNEAMCSQCKKDLTNEEIKELISLTHSELNKIQWFYNNPKYHIIKEWEQKKQQLQEIMNKLEKVKGSE